MWVRSYDPKTVRLYWGNEGVNKAIPHCPNEATTWDQACIWAIETFGLPGEKFECHSNEDWMDFEFVDDRDALIFLLKFR